MLRAVHKKPGDNKAPYRIKNNNRSSFGISEPSSSKASSLFGQPVSLISRYIIVIIIIVTIIIVIIIINIVIIAIIIIITIIIIIIIIIITISIITITIIIIVILIY